MTARAARRAAPTQPAEVHVHIGRVLIDAATVEQGGLHDFRAALQSALARRFSDAASLPSSEAGVRRFSTTDAVADAVAARVRPSVGVAAED